jgi:hypothetical protein
VDICCLLYYNNPVSTTPKDIILLATGAIACYLGLSLAANWLAPEKTCGFDGQPDAHWQAEFNKLEEKYKGGVK